MFDTFIYLLYYTTSQFILHCGFLTEAFSLVYNFLLYRFSKRVVDPDFGDAKDTRWSPLYHRKDDVKKVPPALFILAEVDPCKDDGKGIRTIQ